MIPKTILITGASSGLGSALALEYSSTLKNKVRLCLQGRDKIRLESIVKQCQSLGSAVDFFIGDVCDQSSLQRWVLECDNKFKIDTIIANAGISGGTLGLPPDEWTIRDRQIFDVNLMGVLNTILPIIPKFCERRTGQIAIISSLAGFAPWPGAPAYAASKAALRVYGEALAGTLKPYNIFVTNICPGFIKTPMTNVNQFPMPLQMSAERAAKKIIKAINAKKVRYAFPWPTAFVAQCLGIIPPPLIQYILQKAPEKP
jgi:short-subunit dehydrogenase